jgi:hypothetical protein
LWETNNYHLCGLQCVSFHIAETVPVINHQER